MKKGLLKHILYFLSDLLLLGILVVLIAFGMWGVKPSFRNPAIATGAYQVEEFDKGLSVYQFGRVSPFYTFSFENDYVVSDGRVEVFISGKNYLADEPDYLDVVEGVGFYLGVVNPTVSYKSKNAKVVYEALETDRGIEVVKKLDFGDIKKIDINVMSLSFGDNDILFDGVTGQDFTGVNEEWRYKLLRYYRFLIKRNEELTDYMRVDSKTLRIINPLVPGFLEIKATGNQEMYVNKSKGQIEIVEEVGREVSSLEMRVLVEGKRIGSNQ